ncbi:MAG: DUF1127 domain-containing protein [Paracoccaceae bacterium]
MAAFDTTRPSYGSAPVAGQFTRLFTGTFSNLRAWNDARLTRNALSALSDRELEDIGLIRGDIDDVAFGRR